MIKVVHIIVGLETGGTQMMLYRLLSAMDRSRFSCRVISLINSGGVRERIKDLGIAVDTLGCTQGLPSPMAFLRTVRILRKYKPDIVQTWLYHSDLLGLLAAKTATLSRVVWNVRCANLELEQYRKSTTWTINSCKWLSRFPDAVIFNSHAGRQFHFENNYRPRMYKVIPNGFNTHQFKPNPEAKSKIRQSLGIPLDVPLVGLVARFDPMKDHFTFIQSARKILEEKSEVRFLLCGEGTDERNAVIKGKLEELGIIRSFFLLGERDDMPQIMASLDVLASSSCGEGFPNVLGEAMACGVPCVATAVGDTSFVIGDTGVTVPPKNPEALASGLLHILSAPRKQRKELGKEARNRIKKYFSINSIAQQYQDLYLSVLQ